MDRLSLLRIPPLFARAEMYPFDQELEIFGKVYHLLQADFAQHRPPTNLTRRVHFPSKGSGLQKLPHPAARH